MSIREPVVVEQNGIKYTSIWRPNPGPQEHVLSCPVSEIFFGGARGGGKSDVILGEWAAHAQIYGPKAIGLCIRKKRTELVELVERSKVLYNQLGASFNATDHVWRFTNGARLRFAYLEQDSDANNYQGHAYTRVYVDEIGTFANPSGVLKLMATLDRDPTVPGKFIATGNPGGVGHNWVKERYVSPDPMGYRVIKSIFPNPFTGEEVTKERIFIPSKVTDNPYTNTSNYIANLYSSGSESLVKAWLLGEWNVIAGSFFPEFSEEKHVIKKFVPPSHWTRFMSMDWGYSTPFSIGWWCIVPDAVSPFPDITPSKWVRSEYQNQNPYLPRGAIIRYREFYGSAWRDAISNGVAVSDTADPNVGMRLTATELAAKIRLMEAGEPRGPDGRPKISYRVADPKIFAWENGPPIAEQMGNSPNYIHLQKADNKRVGPAGAVSGWNSLRERLKGNTDGRPMIYFMDNCPDVIRTLPVLQHDDKRPEDLNTRSEDHAVDETRYACMSRPFSRSVSTPMGNFIAARDGGYHDGEVKLSDDMFGISASTLKTFNEDRIQNG